MPEVFVRPPVLAQFDRGPFELPLEFSEFCLKPAEKRKCVGRSTRKTCQDLTIQQPPNLAGVAFHDRLAERDLPVPGHRYEPVSPYKKDRGRTYPPAVFFDLHKS